MSAKNGFEQLQNEYRKTAEKTLSTPEQKVYALTVDELLKKLSAELDVLKAPLGKLNYNLHDVERFAETTHSGKASRFGLFLTAAINGVIDEADTINLDISGKTAEYLLTNLDRGTIVVSGGHMSFPCMNMSGGTVIIHTPHNGGLYRPGYKINGGKIVAFSDRNVMEPGMNMQDGEVTIMGCAKSPGYWMKSGTINIYGIQDGQSGCDSKGGRINISAPYGAAGHDCYAEIKFNGEKIETPGPNGHSSVEFGKRPSAYINTELDVRQ